MRRLALFSFIVAACLFAGNVSASAGSKEPRLVLNGEVLAPREPPKLVNSVSLVPVRVVSEHLGYRVDYDQANRTVIIQSAAKEIRMTIGDRTATVNGTVQTMAAAPVLTNGTTLVPLRFVGETMGLAVYWDNASKSAFLYTTPKTDPPWQAGNAGGSTGNAGQANPSKPQGGLIGTIGGNGPDGPPPQSGGPGFGGADGTPSGNGQLIGLRYEKDTVIVQYAGKIEPRSEVLTNPHRIVIDFPGAVFAGGFPAGKTAGTGDAGSGTVGGSGTLAGSDTAAGGEAVAGGETAVSGTVPPDGIPTVSDGAGGKPEAGGETSATDTAGAASGAGSLPDAPAVFAPPAAVSGELPVEGHAALYRIRYSVYQGHPRLVLDLRTRWNFSLIRNDAAGELRIALTAPKKYVVVLDAGHGGSDPGARSVNGRWEKEFNLAVVRKVRDRLANDPFIQLVLTRENDTYPTLDERVQLANSLGADLFVSVHANSNTNPKVNGTETYYTHDYSLSLAQTMHRHLVAATGFKDNGIRRANFKVIKYTKMPAVLLEVGYLSNSDNARQLYSESFQNRVADAIVAGIRAYLGLS